MKDRLPASILGAAIVIASVVLALGMVSLGNKIEKAAERMSFISVGGKQTDVIPVKIYEIK